MPRRLAEQVVVVVGASSGIGRVTALRFAAAGARVVCAARNTRALDGLVEEVRGAGGRAVAVTADIADEAAVRAVADVAVERFGRVDTWVNAAGIGVYGRVEDTPAGEFDRVMRVNYLGHVHGAKAALPALRRAGGGVLIGVASVLGLRSAPLQAPYAASKAAVRAFYDALRVELAHDGESIAVTAVLPAAINSPFFEHCRSRVGSLPKPPPPVYAPELVAEAVLRAAERPRREVPVGDAALAFYLGQRLFPALTDALMSVRAVGRSGMRSELPDNGVDNVDSPVDEDGRVHGSYPGRVLDSSPVTALLARVPRPGELATSLVSGAHRVGGAVRGGLRAARS
ncbi:SDR family oxidoreductase [Actinosynnema pretiosum]|uniref:Short-chain dehydrogenase n=2 Tax=Actinosynnema pretiosum TaxID=42197 RepID=A0A290Z6H3_9PSEU|nr:SDR family oxidoreductase [Actinosynnema pretiosum]AAM54105.1 glucose 1-dehydrogenase [Actinosynnema pretiosum subsp. auranticum]ATE54651.1 short-chain dehydrogenase [Actinosynnema pretiosum]